MDNVTLREISKDDLELIRKWRSSPEVNKFMYTETTPTQEQQVKWFEGIKNDTTSKYWMIEYNSTPIGVANLINISSVHDSCDWAFYLGDVNVRGKGIGSKIEFQVIEYVFETLGLNKLKCEVIDFNDKVIKMHEKFGFRREAFYRDHVRKGNLYYDVVGLGLLKVDWLKIKKSLKDVIYR